MSWLKMVQGMFDSSHHQRPWNLSYLAWDFSFVGLHLGSALDLLPPAVIKLLTGTILYNLIQSSKTPYQVGTVNPLVEVG
jgi:hypothetical protein